MGWGIRLPAGRPLQSEINPLVGVAACIALFVSLWSGTSIRAHAASPDYATATWVGAAAANYTLDNRPHDRWIDLIVIHDIEGDAPAAIASFQNPARQASAHYVVGYDGSITQMVQEKDIAWHAGNWDYNTRAIGIEHAGYAGAADYTPAEYDASAYLIASICSRYGVPMDRSHVIGHSQVPDPTNPALLGGIDHHTDPGPNWDWATYMGLAQKYAADLPSPPRLGAYPVASLSGTTATVRWTPARTCHTVLAGYTVTEEPDGLTKQLPATATSVVFSGLKVGPVYTFKVTANNADGSDSLTSNSVVPGPKCTTASLRLTSPAPRLAGSVLTFSATAGGCPAPRFEYWTAGPSGRWHLIQPWTDGTFNWNTAGLKPGRNTVRVWAIKTGDSGSAPEAVGYTTVTLTGCTSASATPRVQSTPVGSSVNLVAAAGGCPAPQYEYWTAGASGRWHMKRGSAADASWAWDTSGNVPGKYTVRVWANQQGAYTGSPQAIGTATVILTGCASATIAPSVQTARAGSTVTLNATSGGCPSPQYEFAEAGPSGRWHVQRTFAGDATWAWDTTNFPPGKYTVRVWANQQGGYTGSPEAAGTAIVILT